MHTLLKYAKNAAIAYSHKTDMPTQGEADFHREACDSRQLGACTQLQQSQCHAAIEQLGRMIALLYTNHLLYTSSCISRHLQLRTGGLCWCKVLLLACPCWPQPVHSD